MQEASRGTLGKTARSPLSSTDRELALRLITSGEALATQGDRNVRKPPLLPQGVEVGGNISSFLRSQWLIWHGRTG